VSASWSPRDTRHAIATPREDAFAADVEPGMTLRTSVLRGAALVLALSTLVTTGCASARMIYREPERGELALSRDNARARRLAAQEMADHCGAAGYRIVREENVTVGETTQAFGQGQLWGSGGQVIGQTSTTPVRELHVTYECGPLMADVAQ
jgi:hypothetical protein